MRQDVVGPRLIIIALLVVLLTLVISFSATGQVENGGEGLRVSLDTSNVEIVLGHRSDHVLSIENLGDDTQNVTIKFDGDYKLHAWVESYYVPVGPGQTRSINMKIYAPIGKVEEGNYSLIISATSTETGATDSHTVWIEVKKEKEELNLTWLYILIPVILIPLIVGFITYRVIVNMQKTFKVFEVFIVYNDGRLIKHFPEREEKEEDISISALFTAIQEFMTDSFEYGTVEDQGYLSEVVFGNIKVYIERGVLFYIALVTKGEPPKDLRKRMNDIREGIEERFEEELEEWDGNLEPFEDILDVTLDQELDISYRSS
jgi:hypothetical protein